MIKSNLPMYVEFSCLPTFADFIMHNFFVLQLVSVHYIPKLWNLPVVIRSFAQTCHVRLCRKLEPVNGELQCFYALFTIYGTSCAFVGVLCYLRVYIFVFLRLLRMRCLEKPWRFLIRFLPCVINFITWCGYNLRLHKLCGSSTDKVSRWWSWETTSQLYPTVWPIGATQLDCANSPAIKSVS